MNDPSLQSLEARALPGIPGDYQHRALLRGHPVQRRWHAAKLDLIEFLLGARPRGPILDAGCGSGVVSAALAATGVPVVGVDSNPESIAYAKRHFGRPNLRFERSSLFDFAETGFGTIVFFECLEHFPPDDGARLLRHLRGRAAPDGRLLLTTPNDHSAWPLIEKTLDALHLTPRLKGDQHLNQFRDTGLRAVLQATGWIVMETGSFNGLAPFLAVFSELWAKRRERELLADPARRRRTHRNLLFAWCRAGRSS